VQCTPIIFGAKESLGWPRGFSKGCHFCGISQAHHYWDVPKGQIQNWHFWKHKYNNQNWQDLIGSSHWVWKTM